MKAGRLKSDVVVVCTGKRTWGQGRRTREEAGERGVVQAIEGFIICAKNIGVLF